MRGLKKIVESNQSGTLDAHSMVKKNIEKVKSHFLEKVEMFNKILVKPPYLDYW